MRKNESPAKTGTPRAHRIWALIFSVWLLLLSGTLAPWGGPPGAVQSFRLTSLLTSKRQQANQAQSDNDRLQGEASMLEKSKVAQHREIRRVLGYAAADEIIFDFTDGNSL